jgi:hypothetical protein
MSGTDGYITQDLPNPDLQLFRGPSDFVDTSGFAAYTQSGGLYYLHVPATDAATFITDALIFSRTGFYPTTASAQEQYGTSLSLPGPQKSLPNSGDPDGLNPGYPPILSNQMATLGNIRRGPVAKGMMLTSIDVIYRVNAVAATLGTCSITAVAFVSGSAPVITNIIPLGANGLTLAASANPYVITIPVTSPAFLVTPDMEIIDNVNFTAGAGGTVDFFGLTAHYSYNFN